MTRTTTGSITSTLHPSGMPHMFEQCDRCTAAAKVHVTKHGMELGFCQHHYNENATELLANYWLPRN